MNKGRRWNLWKFLKGTKHCTQQPAQLMEVCINSNGRDLLKQPRYQNSALNPDRFRAPRLLWVIRSYYGCCVLLFGCNGIVTRVWPWRKIFSSPFKKHCIVLQLHDWTKKKLQQNVFITINNLNFNATPNFHHGRSVRPTVASVSLTLVLFIQLSGSQGSVTGFVRLPIVAAS